MAIDTVLYVVPKKHIWRMHYEEARLCHLTFWTTITLKPCMIIFISKETICIVKRVFFFYRSALNLALSSLPYTSDPPCLTCDADRDFIQLCKQKQLTEYTRYSVLPVHTLQTAKLTCLLLRFPNLALHVHVFIYTMATQQSIHTELLLTYSCFFFSCFFFL